MDYTSIAASVITGLLSVGFISVFVKNHVNKVAKYAIIAKDAVETLSDVANALKDGALSAEEIEEVKADIARFQVDLKG